MTLPEPIALRHVVSLVRALSGRGLWAWIKSASPSAASSRSGLRKTSANAGDGGHVSSGSLVNHFGFTRHGPRNNGAFLLSACSTPMRGQEASGSTGPGKGALVAL